MRPSKSTAFPADQAADPTEALRVVSITELFAQNPRRLNLWHNLW